MGLLTCTLCGCAITAERKKSKYVYYHCTNFGGDCANTYIREEKLGILLGDVIKPRFTSPTNSHVPRLFLRTHPSITLNPIVIASAPTPMDGAWIAGARCPALCRKVRQTTGAKLGRECQKTRGRRRWRLRFLICVDPLRATVAAPLAIPPPDACPARF